MYPVQTVHDSGGVHELGFSSWVSWFVLRLMAASWSVVSGEAVWLKLPRTLNGGQVQVHVPGAGVGAGAWVLGAFHAVMLLVGGTVLRQYAAHARPSC